MREKARSSYLTSRSHAGLAYQALAPTTHTGKVENQDKDKWFENVVKSRPDKDYEHTYKSWYEAVRLMGFSTTLTTTSPLLLGVGQPSAVEIGLTIHPTWGVPYIPGSALKGLLSHYMMATYGPEELGVHPQDTSHPEPERAPYQGVSWAGPKIQHGPGLIYKAIFGAPTADDDDDYEGAGAAVGGVIFHDALMEPLTEDSPGPYMRDVVNPHVSSYYRHGERPNDRENPIPVFFLAVRPGLKFTLALGGDVTLHPAVLTMLSEALSEWGVGAKTRAGYGRAEVDLQVRKPVVVFTDTILDEIKELLGRDLTARERFDLFEQQFLQRLRDKKANGNQEVVNEACKLCRQVFRNKVEALFKPYLQELTQ